jgi:hypothetical protein
VSVLFVARPFARPVGVDAEASMTVAGCGVTTRYVVRAPYGLRSVRRKLAEVFDVFAVFLISCVWVLELAVERA